MTNDDLSAQIARLDERCKSTERRVARIEIGILAVLAAAAWLFIEQVIVGSGVSL